MKTNIAATEAARHLSAIMPRVKCKHERFVLTNNGWPIVEICPHDNCETVTWAELAGEMVKLPYDTTFADDLERAGNWSGK